MFEISFILITVLTVALFYFATGNNKIVLMFFSVWALFIGTLSYIGFFENTSSLPPRFVLAILPTFFFAYYFIKNIAIEKIKLHYMIAIHMVRLPVELTLFELFLQKRIPIIMTFEGWNFDILMGISAIFMLIYLFIKKETVNKMVFKAWNIIGICFLTIIVSTAILSAPTIIQQFAFDQPNIGVLAFPFTFLPSVVVPIVLMSHIFCLKILNKKY